MAPPSRPSSATQTPYNTTQPGATITTNVTLPPSAFSSMNDGSSNPHQRSSTAPRLSTAPSAIKPRQLAHLHAQLAQLQAHMSDLEHLVRMTAVQAEFGRGLGGWMGGLFMAASKVLGEETVTGQSQAQAAAAAAANSSRREPNVGGDGRHRPRQEDEDESSEDDD